MYVLESNTDNYKEGLRGNGVGGLACPLVKSVERPWERGLLLLGEDSNKARRKLGDRSEKQHKGPGNEEAKNVL